MGKEVRALLDTAQRPEEELDSLLECGRVNTVLKVRDQKLLRTRVSLDAAEIGKLRPRWEGFFRIMALAGLSTYTLALPGRFKCCPTVEVERIKPDYAREDRSDPLDLIRNLEEYEVEQPPANRFAAARTS